MTNASTMYKKKTRNENKGSVIPRICCFGFINIMLWHATFPDNVGEMALCIVQ